MDISTPDDVLVLTILRDDFGKHRIYIERITFLIKTKRPEIENRIGDILQDLVNRKLVDDNKIAEYWINGNGEEYLREYEEKIKVIKTDENIEKNNEKIKNKVIAWIIIIIVILIAFSFLFIKKMF